MMMTVLPMFDQLLEDVQEFDDVVGVQADGGLVEKVEGAAGRALGELAGEAHALGFAAGEGGDLLAELQVAEADGDQGFEDAHRFGDGGRNASASSTVIWRIWPRCFPLVKTLRLKGFRRYPWHDFADDFHGRKELHRDECGFRGPSRWCTSLCGG